MSFPTNQKEVIKLYKKWCLKANEAANKAKSQGVIKENFHCYIAADNIAKELFAKIH